MRRVWVIVFIGLWWGESAPIHAYLDPGGGSMMLQLLLGGAAGGMVLIKLFWRRVTERVRLLVSRSPRRSA